MKKRKKAMLTEVIIIVTITTIAVLAMVNFKDYINKSEAIKFMDRLSTVINDYKENYGAVPPESYIQQIKDDLQGSLRLGGLQYRSRWIDFDSPPDTILAYTERNYRSPFVGKGFIVLRLDGEVQWMEKKEFKQIFTTQQKPQEIELLKKKPF
ncbi:MAG: hypothetical protein KAS96_12705 [Planctomycetes bacterium]|nr:hypothetical protein [Planctomycetota bacterium]